MKLLNERNQVRTVLERWERQYGTSDRPRAAHKPEVRAKLAELDLETATAADVAAAIGNDSWVKPQRCDECGAVTWNAVEIGEPADYESATATICGDCIRQAAALLENAGC